MSDSDKYYARFYFLNEQMQYVHVAEVEVPPTSIFNETAIWKAHLYTFIPKHNQNLK
jgi:hypothetical protein